MIRRENRNFTRFERRRRLATERKGKVGALGTVDAMGKRLDVGSV